MKKRKTVVIIVAILFWIFLLVENSIKPTDSAVMLGSFLRASIVKTLVEQYNRDKFRNPFLGRGVVGNESKS